MVTIGHANRRFLGTPRRRFVDADATRWWIYVMTGFMFMAVAWLTLGGEQHLFSTTPAPMLVEVETAVLSEQAEGPPSYLYTVTLPDGTRAPYNSVRRYNVGDRITVIHSRGKLTGRVLLTTPAVDGQRGSDRR